MKSVWKAVGVKLSRWLIFSVAFALLPFAINWWHFWKAAGNRPINLTDLWPRGELLLVSVAIAADAIGELIGNHDGYRFAKLIAGGGCALALFVSAAWFSECQFAGGHEIIKTAPIAVTTLPATDPTNSPQLAGQDMDKVSSASMWVFLGTIVSGGACKVLSELKPD